MLVDRHSLFELKDLVALVCDIKLPSNSLKKTLHAHILYHDKFECLSQSSTFHHLSKRRTYIKIQDHFLDMRCLQHVFPHSQHIPHFQIPEDCVVTFA